MKNRVTEVRNVPASQLRANPRNWRLHPDEQRSALSSMLEEIGFVGTLIARDTPDGLELIDGHLRADLADDAEVPVAIVDLDDDEAARVLATFDPLGEMALVDTEQLKELIGIVEVDGNAEFRRIVADLHRQLAKEEVEGKDPDAKREVPGMELQPHEHYDYLVVLATSTQEWNILCDRLGLEPQQSRRGRMGIARAIRAGHLLTVLSNAGLRDRVSGKPRKTAIDGRTTRHPGYAVSQRKRKRIEEIFDWTKAVGGVAQVKVRGLAKVKAAFTFAVAAYNLLRIPKLLLPAAA